MNFFLQGIWKRKVLEPLLAFAGQGMTAETMALTVALGFVLGVFPVLGCPTIFCVFAALVLRLNLPAIQFVNYLVYPLQLTLLVPFLRLGKWLFGFAPGAAPVSQSFLLVHPNAWQIVLGVMTAALHAIAAWFCVCVPAGVLLYVVLTSALRRFAPTLEESAL